jgi:uncharacterized protein YidB (DUF937 family)
MALFDQVLDQTNAQFNLGEKSTALLEALLAVVNENGLAAFLDKFHRAGLGRVADSWVANGANTALSRGQLTDGLGAEIVKSVAQKADVPLETATPALAMMIPQMVDLMTPDGVVSGARQSRQYLAGQTIETIPAKSPDSSLLRVILPLILLAVLVGIGFSTCQPNRGTRFVQPAANSSSTTNSNANAATNPSHGGH